MSIKTRERTAAAEPAGASKASRRRFLEGAAATGLAASIGPFVVTRPARAANTLRILQWNHFVPAYDTWFNGTYVME
jgi:multiple sugar transport system substrate-binding protein